MPDTKPLAKQVALITGASRGIGLAIARRLGQMGARLALCARNVGVLQKVVAELNAEGIEAHGWPADVTKLDQIETLLRTARQQLGELDILVNNAGIGVFGPAHELSEADWDRVHNTNLKAVFLLSKAVAPQMIARRRGHIVNISSLAGKNVFAGGGIYCASKWGLQGLTGCMAEDLRQHGIRVSAVCPGSVHTDFSPHAGKAAERMLQPDDVAHVVAMLVTQSPTGFASEVLLRPTQKP
jgi:NAD(P)-dependent dehydrogenase (short-subunit alcohol dehydrogenase family)